MEHYFIYNGHSSAEFGVWISGGGTYDAPARDVTTEAIPGRNGVVTFDNGRFENIQLTYPAFISRRFQPRIDGFRAFMTAQRGYHRLEDTYHPDEYRLAMFKSGLDVTTTARNLAGSFNVVFDCKPQRFLKSGEQLVSLSSGAVLYNPTHFDALPLIVCSGNGLITLNGTTIAISGNDGQIYIDCDLQDAYLGDTNKNGMITPEFPMLSPGENLLQYTGVTGVQIAPRWWTM